MKKFLIVLILTAITLAYAQHALALGGIQIVQWIRTAAAELPMSSEQASELTADQAIQFMSTRGHILTPPQENKFRYYWRAIKIMLVNDALERERIVTLEAATLIFEADRPNGNWRNKRAQEVIGYVIHISGGGDPNAI